MCPYPVRGSGNVCQTRQPEILPGHRNDLIKDRRYIGKPGIVLRFDEAGVLGEISEIRQCVLWANKLREY